MKVFAKFGNSSDSEGVRGGRKYRVKTKKWGDLSSQVHFELKWGLWVGQGVL